MIRRVVTAPVALVMLPIRVVRRIASMRFSTVLAIGTGAAAAFTAARRLMNREEAVYELPEGLQQPAARAQSFLAESRTELSRAMTAADEERAAATAELRREHLRRTGRLEE